MRFYSSSLSFWLRRNNWLQKLIFVNNRYYSRPHLDLVTGHTSRNCNHVRWNLCSESLSLFSQYRPTRPLTQYVIRLSNRSCNTASCEIHSAVSSTFVSIRRRSSAGCLCCDTAIAVTSFWRPTSAASLASVAQEAATATPADRYE